MKRTLLMSAALCVLVACTKQVQLTQMQRVQQGDPIIPVHLLSDNMNIEFTDYVPSLVNAPFDKVLFDEQEIYTGASSLNIAVSDYSEQKLLNAVHTISFVRDGDRVDVAIMPPIERLNAMYTVGCNNNSVTIGFAQEIKDLHFKVFWQNRLLHKKMLIDNQDGTFTFQLPQDIKHSGRSFLRIFATGEDVLLNDVLVPLQDMKPVRQAKQLTREDHEAQVLYSLMVDRFNNGNKDNDMPMNRPDVLPIVDYMGGDLAGITQKINEGFFTDLGVNTLWISPIIQNCYTAWGYYAFNFLGDEENGTQLYNNKYDKTLNATRFSAYHGYWPIYPTQVDKRFGTPKELRDLLAAAHKHNINVITDYVANHIHIESPIIQQHPDWITDSILPDGRRNFELWDEARLTTWFDSHIPTLDLERKEVYEPMTDSALVWVTDYEFDGYRHDACKHIPECYWRTFTQKLVQRVPDRKLWMVGETYGSPELISSYVKTGMLNAQFDFNVYFTMRDAIIRENGDMQELARVIEESMAVYGAHHTMTNITGNHDQGRFISYAGGAIQFEEDAKDAGWTREVGVGDADKAYKRSLLMEVINMTIPGVPCIYQGDEYGEPGGNDPDNRKMMRFGGLNDREQELRNQVKNLIKLRRNSMPLLYGDYLPLYVDEDVLCFERVYMGERIRVAINKSLQDKTIYINEEPLQIAALSYVIK